MTYIALTEFLIKMKKKENPVHEFVLTIPIVFDVVSFPFADILKNEKKMQNTQS